MDKETLVTELKSQRLAVYPRSVDTSSGSACAVAAGGGKKFIAVGGAAGDMFAGERSGMVKLCAMTVENAKALMELFPYTAPVPKGASHFTFGLGDRLGLATPGHARAIAGRGIFPVFAQQSVRELALTSRSFGDVVAAAAFAVFQEGYRLGYGADGDHLKTAGEIDAAIDGGCTMITLDCSEHIGLEAYAWSDAEAAAAYASLPAGLRERYEGRYLDRELPVVGRIGGPELRRIALVFHAAVDHAARCFRHIARRGKDVDFELSIDETRTATTPKEHYVVAADLMRAGIKISSLAPHFCGEFEKGVDYAGNIGDFTRELERHQRVAEHMGYRVSLHSASDKFSIFPVFGRLTRCRAHVKTAGTHWLEAMRIVARLDPPLYRRAHAFAAANRKEAEKHYHVTTRAEDAADVSAVPDEGLVACLDEPASRQTLHICYGLLLGEKWFKGALYRLLADNEELYYAGVKAHLEKHLDLLAPRGAAVL
jgi:hypothetical protein